LSENGSESGTVDLDFRAVFDCAPDGIVVVDSAGRIVDVNPCAEEQFGYEAAELVGQPIEVLVPQSQRAGHQGHRESYHVNPAVRSMGVGLVLTGQQKDGHQFPVEISLSPWRSGDDVFVIAIIRDVTERWQLRAFGQGALKAAEDERQRISRELHDDTAQRLATLLIRLRLASQEEHAERRASMLDDLREGLQETAEGVRRIARGLRPPALEDAGVVTALQAHIRNLFETHDIRSSFDAGAVDQFLGEDTKLVLYRVVQEALSNVVRHSGASSVKVSIQVEGASVVAVVEDDGSGFDERAIADGGGLGLVGMRERAASTGGTVSVDSIPGEGTQVRLSIPQIRGETLDG
jgi:PAS domain S-box-containing protein